MALAKGMSVFRRTRELEREIDDFLDMVSEAGILYKIAVHQYLLDGASEDFNSKLQRVNRMESDADALRRYLLKILQHLDRE